ncbi:MAG: ParB N-terminal domain-containing protein, partial [Anaerolineales bacterium]|nr:ParB N-terminal domain-containing protein [Anaerolineales bacterium]
MAKKKTALGKTLFSEIRPYDTPTQPESRDSGYQLVPLVNLLPDAHQPRQLLPRDLIDALHTGQLDPLGAMSQWLARPQRPGDQSLAKLRQLANSIAQHGLIQPITIRPAPAESRAEYLIVTGERRFWAHVLLAVEGSQMATGDSAAPVFEIKTILADQGVSIRAIQLIENIQREDINGVEKAMGLWALRFELSGVDINTLGPEVNHGSLDLVDWKSVSASLGMSDRYRVYVTNVMNLTDDAKALVMAHNLTERTIRPIVQKLKNYPELQLEALEKLASWREQDTDVEESSAVRSVEQMVTRLLASQNRAPSRKPIKG